MIPLASSFSVFAVPPVGKSLFVALLFCLALRLVYKRN